MADSEEILEDWGKEIRGYGVHENDLQLFYRLLKKSSNFEKFILETETYRKEESLKQFSHNLTVLKTAALFAIKRNKVHFVDEDDGSRNADLVLDRERDKKYCEVKKKTEDQHMDIFDEKLQRKIEFQDENYGLRTEVRPPILHEKLEKKKAKIPEIRNKIEDSIAELESGEHLGVSWKFQEKGRNKSDKSLSIPVRDQIEYWAKDKIEYAEEQLKGIEDFEKGFIVIDFGAYNIQKDYLENYIADFNNKHSPEIRLMTCESSLTVKTRNPKWRGFVDDFKMEFLR